MTESRSGALLARRRQERVEVLTVLVAEVYEAEVIERLGRQIRRAVSDAEPDADAFVLDLSAVQFLTSAVLGLIINLHAALAGRGLAFALAGARGEVRDMLGMTRVSDVLPVYSNVEEALADLGCADKPDGT